MSFRFMVNLKTEAESFFRDAEIFVADWLLSSHRATSGLLETAVVVRGEGDRLMADNGTIQYIRETDELFSDEARDIGQDWRDLKRSLPDGRRIPYSTEVPAALRDRAVTLYETLCDQVDEVFDAIDPSTQFDVQLSMKPTELVAPEDWSVSTALGLGLERELLGFSSSRYLTRNRRSLRSWQEAAADSRKGDIQLYVTLAASDYTTAKAVGREAATWGAGHVALGFAGLNSDNTYTDVSYLPHRHRLSQPGPHRYVRLAEIVCGLRDGYREAGVPLESFHALGLGARTMWPILAAGLDEATAISVDATSAIKDVEGRRPVLYHPDRSHERIAVSEAVGRWLSDGVMPFASPVIEYGFRLLPCDRSAALETLAELGLAEPTHESLHSTHSLAASLPLFANGPGTSLAGRCLAHHNYWASLRYAAAVPTTDRRVWAMSEIDKLAEMEGISITVKNGAKACREVLTSAGD